MSAHNHDDEIIKTNFPAKRSSAKPAKNNANAFNKITIKDLLDIINDTSLDWMGTDNGDTIAKFQARNAQKVAAVIILIGRELETGLELLTHEQAVDIFYDYFSSIEAPPVDNGPQHHESGTGRFFFEIFRGQWKKMFHRRNTSKFT